MRIIGAQEARAVMSNYWEENDISQDQIDRDIKDLHCYMTISIGKGRRIQRAGTGRFALMDDNYEPVPRAWIEEWMVGP